MHKTFLQRHQNLLQKQFASKTRTFTYCATRSNLHNSYASKPTDQRHKHGLTVDRAETDPIRIIGS